MVVQLIGAAAAGAARAGAAAARGAAKAGGSAAKAGGRAARGSAQKARSGITRTKRTPAEVKLRRSSISSPAKSPASTILSGKTPGPSGTVSKVARAAGKRYARRQANQALVEQQEQKTETKQMNKILFIIVLLAMIVKDLTDIILDITGVGTVVTVITGVLAACILVAYYAAERVKPTPKKVQMWLATIVLDILPIPFLGFLITGYTINVILTYLAETNPKLKRIFNAKS